MIISDNPQETANKLGRLYEKPPPNQFYGIGPVILDTWSSASPFTSFDTDANPNMHLVIIADNLEKLWQGTRRLLDIVIETKNTDVDEWLAMQLSGDYSK
jgi:hypothetical protein